MEEKMKKIMLILSILTVSLLYVGCGGSKHNLPATTEGDEPEWYTNVPEDPNILFAAKTATSRDKQLAIDKAVQDARAEIAKQLEVKVQGLEKRFTEETGIGEDSQLLDQFTKANKTIVNQSLIGSKIEKQKTIKDGNTYRAYVLVKLPLGAAKEALLKQIKQNEQIYTKVRASQTFQELDKEIEKMEGGNK
jgi:hypothetical protein